MVPDVTGARRSRAAGWGAVAATLAFVGSFVGSFVGCGRTPVAGGQGGSTSRGGCAPGVTPLEPRTLAQGLFSGLAWNDGAVVATGLDGVMSFPSNGDPASTIAQMSEAYGLVVAGGAAYFTASFPVGAADPQGKQQSAPGLFSVPLSGAGDPTLVIGSFVNIDGAVSDGVAIFLDGGAGAIARVSIADRVRTDLPLPHGISIDALAVHAGVLYVAAQDLASTSASNGVILSLAATGGTARALVTDIGHPWSLVADASGLTWVQEPPIGQFSDSLIVHAGLDGKGGKTLLSHGANSLAVSNGDLYLAWDGISKVPLGGGAETSLVSGLQGPGRLVVSNGNAAWVDPEFQARSATTVPALMTTCW